MRITFVLPWAGLAGGVRVVATYAQRLAASGHTVTVISQPWPRATWRQQLRALLRGQGWLREPAEGSHLHGLNLEHRVLEQPRPVLDADVPDADAVIATWWETTPWVAALSASKGAKVHFIQGYDAVSYEGASPQTVARVHDAWRLPLDKIVVSSWLATAIAPFAHNQPVTCVPNSVDFQQFDAPPRAKQPRFTFGFVHSDAPYKGTDTILAAIQHLRPRLPHARILSFGTDSPKRLPLPPDCQFHLLPPQSTLRDIYASCDAWLFASRQEGFGLPILEAMACRTPVIATPAGAAPDLLAGGGGLLVPMDDPPAMATALSRLAQMPDEHWRQMSHHAYQTARRYSWDDATDLFLAALHAAIARQPAAQSLAEHHL